MASRKTSGGGDAPPTTGTGEPRRLRAPRSSSTKAAKAAPAQRMLQPAAEPLTLEEVLVGFQRSLARATRASLEAARADWEVGFGQRSLYVIDGVGVRLQAGLQVARDPSGTVQAMLVDLAQSSNPDASTIDFRVQARPIEAIAEEQLVLADMDALGLKRPRHPMRLTLIGRRGGDGWVKSPSKALPAESREQQLPLVPLPNVEVTLHVLGSDVAAVERFTLTTNPFGQVDVEIDTAGNRIVSGSREERLTRLDLSGQDDAFFVFATCDSSQCPGLSARLTSNVLAYTVKRAVPPQAVR